MLFDKFPVRSLHHAKGMVMASMTRSLTARAHAPNARMATYYRQRASAGLIVPEGTTASPNGLGFPRFPGLCDKVQADAWRDAVGAVHAARGNHSRGTIFVQLIHCGRVALEIARAAVAAIDSDRVGIRLSPFGVFNGTDESPEVRAQHLALAQSLSQLGLLYVHLLDHPAAGAPAPPSDFKLALRAGFDGVSIACGGFDHASAERELIERQSDLIAFGRTFLANPDLVAVPANPAFPANH